MDDQPDAAAEREDRGAEADRKLHERAMRRFEEAVRPQQIVRQLALAARRFVAIPGAQWEGDFGDQYANSVKMEINKVGRAGRKLKNDLRQNRVVPDFRPAGGKSDNETADTLDGLHRADSYHFKSQAARDNASEEAGYGGFGAYRLTNEWADPLDKDSDEQRINPGMLIPDADQRVFFDPNSTLYDKSDARYAFVLTEISVEAFTEEWGEGNVSSWPDGLARTWYDWYRPDSITQAEYYEIDEKNEALIILTHQDEERREWEKDIEQQERTDLKAMGWKERKRMMKRRRCLKYVLSGQDVLEGAKRIAGGNIPIVPVYNERYYVGGVEWFKGVVQDRMDAQRLYNGQLSKLAETAALAPFERPIFLAEQMPPNLRALWERANVDRHPYALVNPVFDPVTGSIAAMGPIGKVEAPQIPATAGALLEIGNRDLTEDDADDSQQVKANTSEEAMQLAAQRVDAKSGPFLDNVRQSVQREGELYLDMAREVYSEIGRLVETMTQDGDDGEATLGEEFTDKAGLLKTRNNFADGKYKVVASVQEATATRRDRTVKQMLHVAEVAIQAQDVEGAQAALITAASNMDGEGIDDWQKWNRKRGLKLELFEMNEDEEREAKEAAEKQGQQPDPKMEALQAQIEELKSKVELNAAKTQESQASAVLKVAQAHAVGGPEQVPETPSGLTAANDGVEAESKLAGADLARARAEHLRHDMGMQRVRFGHEVQRDEHDRAVG